MIMKSTWASDGKEAVQDGWEIKGPEGKELICRALKKVQSDYSRNQGMRKNPVKLNHVTELWSLEYEPRHMIVSLYLLLSMEPLNKVSKITR